MSTTQPIRNPEQLRTFKSYYQRENPNSRNYILIITGLNSALRISDILSLTYGDVYDYQKKTWKTHITIVEKITPDAGYISILAKTSSLSSWSMHRYLFVT